MQLAAKSDKSDATQADAGTNGTADVNSSEYVGKHRPHRALLGRNVRVSQLSGRGAAAQAD